MNESDRMRFESKVHVEPNTGCHLWLGALNDSGYGVFTTSLGRCRSKMLKAHRVSYEMHVGGIESGKEIDHLCDLRQATHAENTRRSGGWQARRVTHCPKGHAYDEANTRRYAGRRECRACDRIRSAERKAARA